MNKRYLSKIGILSAVVFAGIMVAGFSTQAKAWEPKLPTGVTGPSSWYQNGKDGRYIVHVVKGQIDKSASGVVKTDSDCMADSQGLNHCHNIIQLQSGGLITVQNTHVMANYRCLRVGEKVTLQPDGSPSWLVLHSQPLQ
jgi:hypothetical protein